MDPLEFGGRTFELVVSGTVERDIVLSNMLDAAGMKEVVFANLQASEDAMNAAIATALAGSGKLFLIMGASLVPAGTRGLDWTPALMNETAKHFAQLPGEGNTSRVLVAAVALVRAFFLVELLSTATSRRFSPPPSGSEPLNPGASVATTSSAHGR